MRNDRNKDFEILKKIAKDAGAKAIQREMKKKGVKELGEDVTQKIMREAGQRAIEAEMKSAAVTTAVKSTARKEIAGAGIDVFEVEPTSSDNALFDMDNVIVTPHSAGTSDRARVASQIQVGQEAARLLNGTSPMSLVNPSVRAQIEMRPPATRSK